MARLNHKLLQCKMLNAQTRYVGGAYKIVIVAKFQNMEIF